MTDIENYRSAYRDALRRPIPLEGELRLWLDDGLENRKAPGGWVHLRTVREVCMLLLTERVIELSLDNDPWREVSCSARTTRSIRSPRPISRRPG